MPDYQRLVSYIYNYEEGLKKNNVGYARVESRNGQCKCTLHIATPSLNDKQLNAYLFRRKNYGIHGISIGMIHIRNGIGELKTVMDPVHIMNTPYGIEDMSGIVIYLSDGKFFATSWDEEPITMEMVSTINLTEDELHNKVKAADIGVRIKIDNNTANNRRNNQDITEPKVNKETNTPAVDKVGTRKDVTNEVTTEKVTTETDVTKKLAETDTTKNTTTENISTENVVTSKVEDPVEPVSNDNFRDRKEPNAFKKIVEELEKAIAEKTTHIKEPAETNTGSNVENVSNIVEEQSKVTEKANHDSKSEVAKKLDIADNEYADNYIEGNETASQPVIKTSSTEEVINDEPDSYIDNNANTEFDLHEDNFMYDNFTINENEENVEEMKEQEDNDADEYVEFESLDNETHNANLSEDELKIQSHYMEWYQNLNRKTNDNVNYYGYPKYYGTYNRYRNDNTTDNSKSAYNKYNSENAPCNKKEEKSFFEDHPLAKHIYRSYPRMYPFEDNEVAWCVRFEPQDIGILPMEFWPIGNNSFLHHGYYGYRHLIFARINDEHGYYYILGIPGIYHNREKFMARMFGFDNFKCVKNKERMTGEFGYWYIPIMLQ